MVKCIPEDPSPFAPQEALTPQPYPSPGITLQGTLGKCQEPRLHYPILKMKKSEVITPVRTPMLVHKMMESSTSQGPQGQQFSELTCRSCRAWACWNPRGGGGGNSLESAHTPHPTPTPVVCSSLKVQRASGVGGALQVLICASVGRTCVIHLSLGHWPIPSQPQREDAEPDACMSTIKSGGISTSPNTCS